MRAKFLQDIIDETPKDVVVFTRLYADLLLRINKVLKAKGLSQKELAESLDKKPSEISKWLGGDHNFTLRTLAKLQAELGEELICVPKHHDFTDGKGHTTQLVVHRNRKQDFSSTAFSTFKINQANQHPHAS